MNAHTDPLM